MNDPKATPPSATAAVRVSSRVAIQTQRRKWRQAAETWDEDASVHLSRVIEAVLAETSSGPIDVVVDIGAGTGALSLPLARAKKVIAVDLSRPMLARLEQRAREQDIKNIEIRVVAIEEFDLPPASVDLVVSNYALHHLLDRDKEIFVRRAATWLRPGGLLVIGDMMFGRGGASADRAIIASKVRLLLGRGPGGWWRIVKNGVRFTARLSERPQRLEWWENELRASGLVGVKGRRVVSEGAVVSGRRP